MVEISGRVMDFGGNLLDDADVCLMDEDFNELYQTRTNEKGEYKLEVEPGNYFAGGAVKGYKTENLEFWFWNLIVEKDMVFDIRIHGLEVYGINAFIVQGAAPALSIYFRPMSLKRALDKGIDAVRKEKVMDIAPELKKENIELKINDEPAKVLIVNKVRECAGSDQVIYAYLIQSEIPKKAAGSEHLKIWITLHDEETDERGEGCLFYTVPYWDKLKKRFE